MAKQVKRKAARPSAQPMPIDKAVQDPRNKQGVRKPVRKGLYMRPKAYSREEVDDFVKRGYKLDKNGRYRAAPTKEALKNLKPIGRPKGVKNKYSRDIIGAIMQAGENVGFLTTDPETGRVIATCEGGLTGYFESIAMFQPVDYAIMVARLAGVHNPQPGDGNSPAVGYMSKEQLANEMRERGIPVPVLDDDAFSKMRVISPPSKPKVAPELLPPLPPKRTPGAKV